MTYRRTSARLAVGEQSIPRVAVADRGVQTNQVTHLVARVTLHDAFTENLVVRVHSPYR